MDEDALVKALDKGTILSCGLDVYEEEPKIHPGLIANPRVMLLPHMGTWTEEVSRAITTLNPMARKREVGCVLTATDSSEDGEVEYQQRPIGDRDGEVGESGAGAEGYGMTIWVLAPGRGLSRSTSYEVSTC